MSFASILSGPTEERAPPKRQSSAEAAPTPLAPASAVTASLSPPPTTSASASQSKAKDRTPAPATSLPRLEKKPGTEKRRRNMELEHRTIESRTSNAANGVADVAKTPVQNRGPLPRHTMTEYEAEALNRALADMAEADKSDVEAPGYERFREEYVAKGKKRAFTTEQVEILRRKVFHKAFSSANAFIY